MRRSRRGRTGAALAVLIGAWTGWAQESSLPAERGPGEPGLQVSGENPLGNLAVIGPLERAVVSTPGVSAPVPGLATGIYSRAGDTLAITVSAESFDAQNLWLRALVDGATASPGWVRFRTTADTRGGSRSFTFVQSAVSEGQHLVEIHFFSSSGATAQLRDRSLTVHSAGPGWGAGRLAVASASNEQASFVSAWAPVPNMSTSVSLDEPGNLAVTFSADALAESGRFFARAVVDGVVLSDVLFAESQAPRGPRAYTFAVNNLAAGAHSVRIDWHGEGGSLRVGPRTLSVSSTAVAPRAEGGASSAGFQVAPTSVSSSSYVDLPLLAGSFTSSAASSSAIVTVGGEVRMNGTGRFFLRPVIDGRLAQPGDVEFFQGEDRWRAASFSFALKNLTPGAHSFKVQVAVDPGSIGYVGDRFWHVVHRRRSGSEFVQPLLHPSLTYTQSPRQASFRQLVICFDPVRPAHPAPSFATLYNVHEGLDGDVSIKGFFAENTGGRRVRSGEATYNNCLDGGWNLAPPAHRGDWYWTHQAWDTMFKEALRAADPAVNFHGYDLNRDNRLTPDEVVIELVHPQNVPDGVVRSTSVSLDGVSTPLNVTFAQLYQSASSSERRTNVGVAAHELSHLVFRAEDLHSCSSSTRPGVFSLMDGGGINRSIAHLDPWHKLHAGLITPDLIETGTWNDRTLALRPVESGREVLLLYDRWRRDREYFVIEYRQPSAGTHEYPGAGGVVVWHLFDDPNLAQQFPPSGGESCGWDRNSVRKVKVLRFLGDWADLSWADGTPVGLRATLGLANFDGTLDLNLTRP